MKMFLTTVVLFLFLLAINISSADTTNCFEFRGCIDGSDWVFVNDGHLTLMHDNYEYIGSPGNCPAEYVNVIYIDDDAIEIHGQGFNYYHGDALFDAFVNLDDMQSFRQYSGRGSVTWDAGGLYISDDAYGGGDVYSINICGNSHENEVPEFGLIAGGVALIGALGVFLFMRKQ
jgi:hypothetical protein